ncbi:MAG: hypothetical protein AB8G05_20370 [Oligoflexales bacterium]
MASGCFTFLGCTTHLEKYSRSSARQNVASQTVLPKKVKKLRDRVYSVDAESKWLINLFVDALMEHYNISLLDTRTGLMTTEWDRFYQGDRVYRNKVSVFVRPQGWGRSEVKISNNVEVLSSQGPSSGKIWLPSGDQGAEETRLTSLIEDLLQDTLLHQGKKPAAG